MTTRNSYQMYLVLRDAMQTGDVIAYNGRGPLSTVIRWVTGYPTHVALVSRTQDTDGKTRIQCIESTSMKIGGDRIIGVQRTYLSERVQNYKGDIWWLPLKSSLSGSIKRRQDYFDNLLQARDGSRYDFLGALREGWSNIFPRLFPIKDVDKRFFCSALVAYVLSNMGILPGRINHRTVSPRELCRFKIYAHAKQIAGDRKDIPRFNMVEV